VVLVGCVGEGLDGCRCSVGVENAGDGLEEDSLAVATLAVAVEQRMLTRTAGQRVAGDALQVGQQLAVIAGDLREEAHPAWAGAARCYRRHLGAVFHAVVESQRAGAQVDDAAGRVQDPVVGVPLVDDRGDRPVRSGEPLHRGNGLGAGDGGCNLAPFCRQTLRDLAAHGASKIERLQRLLRLPMCACPVIPLVPSRDVAQVAAVPGHEQQGQRIVGVFGRPRQVAVGSSLVDFLGLVDRLERAVAGHAAARRRTGRWMVIG
jgi:hypothetical protein